MADPDSNEKLCEQSCVLNTDTRLALPNLHPKACSKAHLWRKAMSEEWMRGGPPLDSHPIWLYGYHIIIIALYLADEKMYLENGKNVCLDKEHLLGFLVFVGLVYSCPRKWMGVFCNGMRGKNLQCPRDLWPTSNCASTPMCHKSQQEMLTAENDKMTIHSNAPTLPVEMPLLTVQSSYIYLTEYRETYKKCQTKQVLSAFKAKCTLL